MNIFIDETGTITQVFSSLSRVLSPEELRERAERCAREAEKHPGNPYLRRNLEEYERALAAWEQYTREEAA